MEYWTPISRQSLGSGVLDTHLAAKPRERLEEVK
jgi:hypothetical protein